MKILFLLMGLAPAFGAAISPRIDSAPPPADAPAGMAWIPGGVFSMGCADCDMEDAKPVHWVELAGFWMDATPVTNREFERFVGETRHVTVAEKVPNADEFPGVPKEQLVAGSAVFTPPPQAIALSNPYAWWTYVKGADWKHPEGPGTDTTKRADHPVVHVAHADATAYCTWAKKRLPTEAEYEFAARGGQHRKRYVWGDRMRPRGKWVANIFQGEFPNKDTKEDGYTGTSPVRAFPPNPFGLYDMGGNVWQWCADWYRPEYYRTLAKKSAPTRNPAGPDDSHDPNEPGVKKRVQRGGSFLCSARYCQRYFVGSRGKGEPDSGTSNVSFRCVLGPSPASH